MDVNARRRGVPDRYPVDGDITRRAGIDGHPLEGADADGQVSDVQRRTATPDDIAAAREHPHVGVVADAAVVRADHQAGRHVRAVERITGRDGRALRRGSRGASTAEHDHATAGGMGRRQAVSSRAGIERRTIRNQDTAIARGRSSGIRPIDQVPAVRLHRQRRILQDAADGLEDHRGIGGSGRDAGGKREEISGRDLNGTVRTDTVDYGVELIYGQGIGVTISEPADRLGGGACREPGDIVPGVTEVMNPSSFQDESVAADSACGSRRRGRSGDGQGLIVEIRRAAEGDRAACDLRATERRRDADPLVEGDVSGASIDGQGIRTVDRGVEPDIAWGRRSDDPAGDRYKALFTVYSIIISSIRRSRSRSICRIADNSDGDAQGAARTGVTTLPCGLFPNDPSAA